MSNTNVTVIGAPGYVEHFKARYMLRIEAVDDRGDIAVVIHEGGDDVAVVPADCVVVGLDLVKRFELDWEWDFTPGTWGVRHAFRGPYVFKGSRDECVRWLEAKLS